MFNRPKRKLKKNLKQKEARKLAAYVYSPKGGAFGNPERTKRHEFIAAKPVKKKRRVKQ